MQRPSTSPRVNRDRGIQFPFWSFKCARDHYVKVLTEMTDLEWLVSNGFERVGCWGKPASKLLRKPAGDELRRKPGIYEFIVNGTLCYVGKAARVRSQLRGYNRSLAVETNRPLRRAYRRILAAWCAGQIVDVWAVRAPAIFRKDWPIWKAYRGEASRVERLEGGASRASSPPSQATLPASPNFLLVISDCERVVSRPQDSASSLAHRTTTCLLPSRSPTTAASARRVRHRRAFRIAFPDLARPDRPCRAAVPAGVHGSGILAGLDVLRAQYGTTGHYHSPGRHSGPVSLHSAAHWHANRHSAVRRRGGGVGRGGVGCLRVAGRGAGVWGVMAPGAARETIHAPARTRDERRRLRRYPPSRNPHTLAVAALTILQSGSSRICFRLHNLKCCGGFLAFAAQFSTSFQDEAS